MQQTKLSFKIHVRIPQDDRDEGKGDSGRGCGGAAEVWTWGSQANRRCVDKQLEWSETHVSCWWITAAGSREPQRLFISFLGSLERFSSCYLERVD